MNEIFLWPEAQPLTATQMFGKSVAYADIERQLRGLFPKAEPVLFSSARAGLFCLLDELGLSRPDLVWCPSYSSHCLFDAIARIATPTTLSTNNIRAAVVYHQWGFINDQTFPAGTIIIEDAVDTLFAPGCDPFAIGGRFTLWSLPKTVACQWGGVVFCRNETEATALRLRRDHKTPIAGYLQAMLRSLGKHSSIAAAYWHGYEANGGKLPGFTLRQIASCLEQLPQEVERRRQRLFALQSFSLAPIPPAGRLPSNLPLKATSQLAHPLATNKHISAGIRNFNSTQSAPNTQWISVRPIPIHQGISGTDIAEITARLTLVDDSSLNEPHILR